jgi:GTP cyclohydrolase II
VTQDGIGRPSVRARVSIPLQRMVGGQTTNPTGDLVTFHGLRDGREHVAYVVEPFAGAPLVRVHSECLTGDVLGSARCDCGPQLNESICRIGTEGGVLLYLRQEGRGIGLYNKIDAYHLQDRGADTFSANRMLGRGVDERDYFVAAQMLRALGIRRIRLLTNNDDKVSQLTLNGIEVVRVERTRLYQNPANAAYLEAKARQAGHHLDLDESSGGGP